MADAATEGRTALDALERALAHRPKRDGEAFSAATEHLCRLRTHLTAAKHAQLGPVNAVISAALAGHFPLGETPWPLVEAAAESLRSLLAELAA